MNISLFTKPGSTTAAIKMYMTALKALRINKNVLNGY